MANTDRSSRILNVEDHAPARFLRTRILEGAGFDVFEIGTAAGAVEHAADAGLVLLDVKLPDGDGFDVCERIKSTHPDLPVILVTSVYRTADARRDGFAAGADAFLLEPVDAARLVRTVGDLMTNRRVAEPSAPAEDAWVITSTNGQIEEISGAAAKLLNLSARGALGRSLPAFIVDNRARLVSDLQRAADGLIIEMTTTVHPRDRRPRKVRLEITPAGQSGNSRLRWHLAEEMN
jgi:DNA-binding response OmpR family regulator